MCKVSKTVLLSDIQVDRLMIVGLVTFLLVLPFHLVLKRLIPGPVGTYWKEVLLGLLVVLWVVHCLGERRFLLSGTPLDRAVLVYLGLLLLRFVLDRSGWVGAWGLYMSVMYLPLFWLVPTTLRHDPSRVMTFIVLLVGVGAVVAVGGLVEFALDMSLWPSDEMVQRQGFPDVYIYNTHVRRVYFTFDSPTTLANTLAILLPLALVLILLVKRTWAQLMAGVAAALMTACIIVTFSRGIWVATVLSLLAIGLLSGFVQRHRRSVIVAVGTLALVGFVWVLVTFLHPGQTTPTHREVVELTPTAYRAVPVISVTGELLRTQPAQGEHVIQTWTLFDPIAGRDDTRNVLYEHPPASGKDEIVYRVTVPEAGALRFAIALSPQVWSPEKGDGASFQIDVTVPPSPFQGEAEGEKEQGTTQSVFVRYINPKHNPSDRRWRNFLVDLSPWAGQTVNLSFITEGGPAGDWAYDWAGWADLQLVSVDLDYFARAQGENAVFRHASSILDWQRDETNRDRLAAWGLALNAWRAAPLWGRGLGSTGVAGLRTIPERAFVTESQVLKALVELGLPGLLAFCYLWFEIGRVGYRAYRVAGRTDDQTRQVLMLGILTGLLVVFIEGWVYQNLEVKQVNAYFWTLVGLLTSLAGTCRTMPPSAH